MLSQDYPTEEYPYPRKGILSTHNCIPRDTILQLQYDWKFQEHPRTTLPWYWSQTSQNISRVIWTYPLVNIQKTNWKITMLLMGKLTISMAIFNSFLYVYQAGYQPRKNPFTSSGMILQGGNDCTETPSEIPHHDRLEPLPVQV
jgi:hypothetical protein